MQLAGLVLLAVATLVTTSATPISTEKQIQSMNKHPVNLRSVEERKGGRGGGGRGGGWGGRGGGWSGRIASWSSRDRNRGYRKIRSGTYVPPYGFFSDAEENTEGHKNKLQKLLDKWF